ncbi:hypothetical protein V9K67_21730, partial [Paraflavisolibacter sp. H34]|uniref:hypothetical protein n=1 Tax=Huijunlia imazamoxiresistens TaxID=3127457 RepID=UPI0030185F0F
VKNTNRPMKTALTSEGSELKNYRSIELRGFKKTIPTLLLDRLLLGLLNKLFTFRQNEFQSLLGGRE